MRIGVAVCGVHAGVDCLLRWLCVVCVQVWQCAVYIQVLTTY